jgi:hypothetical protein
MGQCYALSGELVWSAAGLGVIGQVVMCGQVNWSDAF